MFSYVANLVGLFFGFVARVIFLSSPKKAKRIEVLFGDFEWEVPREQFADPDSPHTGGNVRWEGWPPELDEPLKLAVALAISNTLKRGVVRASITAPRLYVLEDYVLPNDECPLYVTLDL
jgi:hypothetical protein